ncbi:MAG: hypothetical protein QW814_02620, partial [Methanothrix sp.]
ATVPKETYKGIYSAHAEPLVSPSYSLTMSVQNSTNPANNAKDELTARVDLLGYPQSGATINFTATFTKNGTDAIPPYSLQSQYVTTGTNGEAVDYIWGSTSGNVTVAASYAGLNATKSIAFVPTVPIYFNVSGAAPYIQSGTMPIATIDGVPYSYSNMTKKPTKFYWVCNSTHTYSFNSPIYNGPFTRYVFDYIEVDGIYYSSQSGTITLSQCKQTSINILYSTQYYLNMSVYPSSPPTT